MTPERAIDLATEHLRGVLAGLGVPNPERYSVAYNTDWAQWATEQQRHPASGAGTAHDHIERDRERMLAHLAEQLDIPPELLASGAGHALPASSMPSLTYSSSPVADATPLADAADAVKYAMSGGEAAAWFDALLARGPVSVRRGGIRWPECTCLQPAPNRPPYRVLETCPVHGLEDARLWGSGQVIAAHTELGCRSRAGLPCPIHNPSRHQMYDWPQQYRPDAAVIERVCPHGVGHPDPDEVIAADAAYTRCEPCAHGT